MATKPKKFDCVEMKRQAQEELLADWERRKHEFSSYGAFLEAGVQQSEWGRRVWERARQQESPTSV
jgi:hypothetical protein